MITHQAHRRLHGILFGFAELSYQMCFLFLCAFSRYKIDMIFHWMIFDENFSKFTAPSLQSGPFLEIKRFCQIVFSMFLVVGIFPIETGMILRLDVFA